MLLKMKLGFAALTASLAMVASAHAAPVIVNEINAGGATVVGDWFELVVVGDGTAGSRVDMRGWTLRVDNNGATNVGRFTLSNNSYWSNVRAGTILTFHEDNAASSGVDTVIQGTNNFSTQGWAWTNIYVGDATYVNTAAGDFDGSFPIDQSSSQVAILDASNAIVFGPAGEGHAGYTGGGVSATEVFKLEANPTPLITLTSPYNDGSTSTFGAPNAWSSGTIVQSFTPYVPEPAALSFLGLGGLALGRRCRR